MKRGFPQKIEPQLPRSLGKDALSALAELAASQSNGDRASLLSQIRQISPEDIQSVIRQADGADWVERYLKPILTNPACQRRMRTSAAVVGLAMAMGASDVLSLMQGAAMAAEASDTSVSKDAQRADELALELQRLAESAAAAVESGDLADFSPQIVAANSKLTDATIASPERVAAIPATLPSVPQSSEVSPQKLELSQLSPYRIQAGDTLDSIARRFDVSRAEIVAVNQLDNPNVLKVDQVIGLPRSASIAVTAVDGVQIDEVQSASAPVVPKAEAVAITPAEGPVQTGSAQLPELPTTLKTEENAVQVPVSMPVAASVPLTLKPLQPAQTKPQAPAQAPIQLQTNPQVSSNYRVQPGDTLVKIARNHGISLTDLSRANGISNPNFIFVGQTLTIPGGIQAQPAPVASPIAAQPIRVAELPSATPKAAAAPQTQAIATAPSGTAENPYVDILMGEIRQMRQQKQQKPESVAADLRQPLIPEPSHNLAPKAEPITVQAPGKTTTASSRVNPEFKPDSYVNGLKSELQELQAQSRDAGVAVAGTQQIPVQMPQPAQPQVVAAASLGSQSYEPLAQSLLSRSVSPELPPLSSESFLPNGLSKGFIWPAQGVLSSGFGWRWGRMHKGIDVAGPVGTPIVAAGGGVITYAGWNDGGYGNLVEITHPDGSVTLYAHNSRVLVKDGQRVRQGEQIALMGSTGFSTGPHLHFEIHPPGQGAVNPIAYLPAQ